VTLPVVAWEKAGLLIPKLPKILKIPGNEPLRRKRALECARVAGEFEIRRSHGLAILNDPTCAFPVRNPRELALQFLIQKQGLESKV
jgi:hypothetical protein